MELTTEADCAHAARNWEHRTPVDATSFAQIIRGEGAPPELLPQG